MLYIKFVLWVIAIAYSMVIAGRIKYGHGVSSFYFFLEAVAITGLMACYGIL